MVSSHLVFPGTQHRGQHLSYTLATTPKAKDPISTIVPKGESGEVPLKAYRTVTCCHPILPPAAHVSTFLTTFQGETISGLS